MKIRVIGGPGSGKTYLSSKISKQIRLPYFSLDDVFWDDSDGFKRRDKETRAQLLDQRLSQQRWVIEGVYYEDWVEHSFVQADLIVVLSTPLYLQLFRILHRFAKRKLRFEPTYRRETVLDLYRLLTWCIDYHSQQRRDRENLLQAHKNKTVMVRNYDEFIRLIEQRHLSAHCPSFHLLDEADH
ncbi:hypothetical protein VHA01S_031_00285 [Vibrio halioticoli NBRC 102217]|uniref:DNA topology modulation protein FlaR n=1 Tax=Vibrio halioticoli NBRC 102217 TaxID=1219072 RepID=V5FJU4_9VIBR|nr:hypothetical protein [Vibrio halioticoli]GAD90016.1 hypothetical protein VHA01S_031_00285 [Vibrio halioticoli NBRC 102217]